MISEIMYRFWLLLKNNKRLSKQYSCIWITFLCMVLMSNFFIGRMVYQSSHAYGVQVLDSSADTINSLLDGYKIIFEELVFSLEDLRSSQGASALDFQNYLIQRNQWYLDQPNESCPDFTIIGVADKKVFFDNKIDIPILLDLEKKPWYTGAQESQDQKYYSSVYINSMNGQKVFSISKLMYENGESFGVLAIVINFQVIQKLVDDMHFFSKGYGVLLDSNHNFVSHPNDNFFGQPISSIGNHDYTVFSQMLDHQKQIDGFIFKSYQNVKSIVYCKQLYNDWFLGLVCDYSVFNRSQNIVIWLLSLIGIGMAITLSILITSTHKSLYQSEQANTLKTELLERVGSQVEEANLSYKKVRNLLDSNPLCCTIWDKNFQIIDCNEATLQILGLKSRQEYIEHFSEFYPKYQPDGLVTHDKITNLVRKAFNNEKQTLEFMLQHQNGTPLPMEMSFVHVDYGNEVAVACYCRNLRNEKQLQGDINLRNRLMSIQNRAAEILLSTDNGNETNIDKILISCMDYLGYTMNVDRVKIWRNEVIDGSLHFVLSYQWLSDYAELRPPEPLGLKFSYKDTPEWKTKFLKGDCLNGPVTDFSKEEQRFLRAFDLKSLIAIPLFIQEQFWGVFSFEDCRQDRYFTAEEINIYRSISLMMACAFLRSEMNKEVKDALEDAKLANKTKSDFLSKMSHEIRTPMNAIIGMSELLLQEQLSERQKNYVDDIYASSQSLLSIINDILDVSKIEAGKLELNPINFDFQLLLDNITSMFKYLAEKKGLEFRIIKSSQLPQCLYGDDIRLRQILTNICGNALKFTQKGSVTLRVGIAHDTLLFEVVDTGIGIMRDEISKLFTAFSQVNTIKNRTVIGTGLGLVISKAFVEMMGGSIFIDSEFGQGSTFTILIPYVEGDINEVTQKTFQQSVRNFSSPEAKILIVDDNEFNIRVATGLLNLFDINADMALSGNEAIQMVQKVNYDLILMDHMMPIMDGVETTAIIRNLKGKYRVLPIIALTANAVYGAKEMFLNNGFNGFISKPINTKELVETIIEWIPKEKIKTKDTTEIKGKQDNYNEIIDKLRKLEEINVKIGLSRVSNEKKVYLNSLEYFINIIKQDCEKMSDFIKQNNLENFGISVHSMKSSLAFIGAMNLSNLANKLEEEAFNKNINFCHANYPPFETKLYLLYNKLSEIFLLNRKKINRKQGDMNYLKEGLRKAIASASSYDNDIAVLFLKDLLLYSYDEKTNIALEKALTYFLEFDFDEGIKTLCDLDIINNSMK